MKIIVAREVKRQKKLRRKLREKAKKDASKQALKSVEYRQTVRELIDAKLERERVLGFYRIPENSLRLSKSMQNLVECLGMFAALFITEDRNWVERYTPGPCPEKPSW